MQILPVIVAVDKRGMRETANVCTLTNISRLTSASPNNQSPPSPPSHLSDNTTNVAPWAVDKGSHPGEALS